MKVARIHMKKVLVASGWMTIAALMFLAWSSAVTSSESKDVKDVQYHLAHLLDGNDLITVEEIKQKILSAYQVDFRDVQVGNLDLHNLESILIEEAFIVDAQAYIDANQVLHIDITQRTPIMRVMDIQGRNYYLDSEGIRLPLSKHFTARVPVVTGYAAEYGAGLDTVRNNLGAAFRIVCDARADEFMHAWLDGINIHNSDEIVLMGNVGRFKVLFGDDDRSKEKIEKLKTFFKEGLKITGWRDLESINVKYDKQVVTKKHTKA